MLDVNGKSCSYNKAQFCIIFAVVQNNRYGHSLKEQLVLGAVK